MLNLLFWLVMWFLLLVISSMFGMLGYDWLFHGYGLNPWLALPVGALAFIGSIAAVFMAGRSTMR